jgi:hypothetical protein
MGGRISVIIFLIVVIVQVIAGLAQSGAKKREKERMRGLAEQRRRELASRGSSPPTVRATVGHPQGQGRPVFSATPAPPTPVRRQEVSALEARRQAQLEELRRRRASRTGASVPTTTTARVSTVATVPPVRPPSRPTPPRGPVAPPPTPIRTVRADRRSVLEAEDRATRERARDVKIQQQHRAEGGIKKPAPAKRPGVRAPRPGAPSARESVIPSGATRVKAARQALHAESLRGQIKDRSTLRDLFILKELLEPPVAMRRVHLDVH